MGWTATTLGAVCGGRDNNLNLIRMIAASAVLVSHAYPITLGGGVEEPLEGLVGHSLGWVAVAIFFVISGFLIARSFDRAPRIADWAAARVLRLFPGLFVVLVLSVLLLGPAMTALPLGAYFSDPATIGYVFRNLSLAFLQYPLPGVFETNPLPHALNGSLWTLFHEVMCYLGVLVLGVFGLLRRGPIFAMAFGAYLAGYGVLGLPGIIEALPGKLVLLRELSLPFALGTAAYVWRDRVVLAWVPGIGLAALAAGALAAGLPGAHEVFLVALAYGTALLAYLPGGILRAYNRLGDYSYGTYVYAFPVQQTVVAVAGPMDPATNIVLALPITLGFAVLSWHMIESPALATRHRAADWLAQSLPGMGTRSADAASAEATIRRPDPR
ncbi:MAG: acyltransferase [Pseudomonadota bacterium]